MTLTPSFLHLDRCPICALPSSVDIGSIKTLVRGFDQTITCDFAYCQACDFAFTRNPFDDVTMREYYSNNDQLRRELLTIEEARHIHGQIGFIRRFLCGNNVSQVLEVGADTGDFLRSLTEELGATGSFDELNLHAARILRAKGLADVREMPPGTQYEIVALRHVFEHIVYPGAYLEALHQKVAPSGMVFLEVPDYSSLILDRSDAFQLEHVNYFTLQSVIRCAGIAGFNVIGAESTYTPGYSTTPNQVLRVLLRSMAERVRGAGLQDQSDWRDLVGRSLKAYQEIDDVISRNPDARFAFYGAGGRTLEYFANSSRKLRAARIFDQDPKKVGTPLNGIVIEHPDHLEPSAFDFLFVMVIGYAREVAEFLEERGVRPDQLVYLGPPD